MSSPPALDDLLLHKLESIAGLTNDDILTDGEISRGRIILAQAQEQLHRLSEHIAKLEVALAPHKRLPNDILIRIFEFFRDEGEKRSPPALILGRVSRLWRAISHSHPELWGTISVDLEESDAKLQRVVNILPNAARLHVRVPPQVDSSALIPFLPRIDDLEWVTLHTGFDDHFWQTFTPLPVAPFSKQTSLKVRLLPLKYSSLDLPSIPLFGPYPQLKECQFESCIPFFLFIADFPWNQIQKMTLRAVFEDREVENTEAVRRFWMQVARLNPFHDRSQLTALSLDLEAQILPIFLTTNIPWNQITSLRVICYDEKDYMAVSQITPKCSALSIFSLHAATDMYDQELHTDGASPIKSLILPGAVPRGLVQSQSIMRSLQILDITMFPVTLITVYAILRQSSGIIEASCRISPRDIASQQSDLPQDVIILPRLQSLRLYLLDTDILSLLITSALTTLEINATLPVNYVPIANFITHSACQVANFSCSPGQWFNVDPIGTSELLSSLEYCTSFNAENICFSADVVDEIGLGTLLPRVRSLRMGVKNTAAFVKCVRDRTQPKHGMDSSDESAITVPVEMHGWIHHGTVRDWNASISEAERELAHLRLPTMVTAELHLHSGENYSGHYSPVTYDPYLDPYLHI